MELVLVLWLRSFSGKVDLCLSLEETEPAMSTMEETSYKVEKLTAGNYVAWKFSMNMYLLGKELWDIVEGSETLAEHADADAIRRFKKRDNQALSIVALSVSKNLHVYIRGAKS